MYVFNSHHLVLAKYLVRSEQGQKGNGKQRTKKMKENSNFLHPCHWVSCFHFIKHFGLTLENVVSEQNSIFFWVIWLTVPGIRTKW